MNLFNRKSTVSVEKAVQSELDEIMLTEKMLDKLRQDTPDSQFIDLNDLKESEFPPTEIMGSSLLSDDINPLAEAEVYIQYKRIDQAKDILEEGLYTHPHLKDQINQKLLLIKSLENDKCEIKLQKALRDAQHDEQFQEFLEEENIEKEIEQIVQPKEEVKSSNFRYSYLVNLMYYEKFTTKPVHKIIRTKLKQGEAGFTQEVLDILKFLGYVDFCIVSIMDY